MNSVNTWLLFASALVASTAMHFTNTVHSTSCELAHWPGVSKCDQFATKIDLKLALTTRGWSHLDSKNVGSDVANVVPIPALSVVLAWLC